jgi:hypothetical protein
MEVGSRAGWPFPPEWGFPRAVPDRARIDDQAAARFLADWARGEIRKRQRARRITPAAAQARLRLLQVRARLLEAQGR